MPTQTKTPKIARPDVDMLPVSTDSFDLFFRHMDRLLKPAPNPKTVVFEMPVRERFPTLAAIGFIFDARAPSLVCPTCSGPVMSSPPRELAGDVVRERSGVVSFVLWQPVGHSFEQLLSRTQEQLAPEDLLLHGANAGEGLGDCGVAGGHPVSIAAFDGARNWAGGLKSAARGSRVIT